jgi:hypothetical protein
MMSESASPTSTPTVLIDSDEFRLAAGDRKLLERAVWRVDRGPIAFLASIVNRQGSCVGVRFDRGCMEPAHPTAEAAAEVLESAISEAPSTAIAWEPGVGVVVDNWRILHGRPPVDASESDTRRLERVLVR